MHAPHYAEVPMADFRPKTGEDAPGSDGSIIASSPDALIVSPAW